MEFVCNGAETWSLTKVDRQQLEAIVYWPQCLRNCGSTVYCRQSRLPGRRCPTLEQLTWQRRFSWFTVDLPTSSQTLSVPAVQSWCCFMTVWFNCVSVTQLLRSL